MAAEQALATTWLRLFTPQLLFIGLITITTALLNARRRFGSVAFSPVLANLVTIAALVVADQLVPKARSTLIRLTGPPYSCRVGHHRRVPGPILSPIPALFRADIPLRPTLEPSSPGALTIGRLSAWTIGAVVANQASFILVSVLANTNGGNLSSFMYAYTFMQLPYAIIAVSIASAVAPDLARAMDGRKYGGFCPYPWPRHARNAGAVVAGRRGYALLAHPAAVLALAHGHLFGRRPPDSRVPSSAVFALGLPGFSAYLLLMRAFQSKQDTRSMFWLYIGENGLTVVAALALYPVCGVNGLAAGLDWLVHRRPPVRVAPFTQERPHRLVAQLAGARGGGHRRYGCGRRLAFCMSSRGTSMTLSAAPPCPGHRWLAPACSSLWPGL